MLTADLDDVQRALRGARLELFEKESTPSELVEHAVAGSSIVTVALHPARDAVVRSVPAGAVADAVVRL